MANQAVLHVTEKDKRGEITWDVVVCEPCMQVHRRAIQIRPGERRIERPWTGAPRECDWCEDSESDRVTRDDFEKGIGR